MPTKLDLADQARRDSAAIKKTADMLVRCSVKILRTFIVSLLLSVLPLQGVASNMVLNCMAAGQQVRHHELGNFDGRLSHAEHAGQHHANDDNVLSGPAEHEYAERSCPMSLAGMLWIDGGDITPHPSPTVSAGVAASDFHVQSIIPEPPEHPPRPFNVV
jgi:hypothetical protein